ncbi:hypothetical protein EDC01DRAFT_698925 [Geopyxis carbonaria]|nr:hypothetical protein EDC01DRAFT_698925 [Geopyxis carbonaria]
MPAPQPSSPAPAARAHATATLPATPFFQALHSHTQYTHPAVISAGHAPKSYTQLLSDIASLAAHLRATLARDVAGAAVLLIAPPGYAYVTAFLAIHALHAAVLPLSAAVLPDEGAWFARDAAAVAVLTTPAHAPLGAAIAASVGSCAHIPIPPASTCTSPPAAVTLAPPAADHAAADGLIVYTSGTTSAPKGVVHTQRSVHLLAAATVNCNAYTPSDRLLHVGQPHWLAAIHGLFAPLLAGASIEFLPGGFTAPAAWARIRAGGITVLETGHANFIALRRHFEALPPAEQDACAAAVRALRLLTTGGAAVPDELSAWWRRLSGKRLESSYGATECGAIALDGAPVPGVRVRVAADGELLVHSVTRFSRYLNAPEATRAALVDGWYRTGDLAVLDSAGRVQLRGRAGTDVIRCDLWKLSAAEVERAVLRVRGVWDAAVVGVPDERSGEAVAVVMCTNAAAGAGLAWLRGELRRGGLAEYMLPTILRVETEMLPRGPTGKVVRRKIVERFFGQGWRERGGVEVWDGRVEEGVRKVGRKEGERRMWMWSGLGNMDLSKL